MGELRAYPVFAIYNFTTSTPADPAPPTRARTRRMHTRTTHPSHVHQTHTSYASTDSLRLSPHSPAVPRHQDTPVKAHHQHTCRRTGEEEARTRRKTAREFRLIALRSAGAGTGQGSGVVVVAVPCCPDAYARKVGTEEESDVAMVATPSLSLGRRTILRPETGEYALLASGVGKKVRSRRR